MSIINMLHLAKNRRTTQAESAPGDALREGHPRRWAPPGLSFISGRCPDPSSPEAGEGSTTPFPNDIRILREPYIKRLSRHNGASPHYSTVLLTTVPLQYQGEALYVNQIYVDPAAKHDTSKKNFKKSLTWGAYQLVITCRGGNSAAWQVIACWGLPAGERDVAAGR